MAPVGKPIISRPVNLRTSFNQLTTLRWSLKDEVEQLKAANYDAIGLWRPKVADHGDEVSAEMIRDAGLAVSSLSFVGGFTGDRGLGYDDAIADGRDAIQQAELLGAENVVVVSGTRNGHTIGHCRRLVLDALLELADIAISRGVKLLLLPMHEFFNSSWTFLNSLDEALDVLSRVNHRSVRLAFDTYQMWKEPQLLDRIAEIAPVTGIVQVSDALQEPQSPSERYNPGDGVIPLGRIIQAFQQAGFDGYYDVHVWSNLGWSGDYAATCMQCRETILRLAEEPRLLNR